MKRILIVSLCLFTAFMVLAADEFEIKKENWRFLGPFNMSTSEMKIYETPENVLKQKLFSINSLDIFSKERVFWNIDKSDVWSDTGFTASAPISDTSVAYAGFKLVTKGLFKGRVVVSADKMPPFKAWAGAKELKFRKEKEAYIADIKFYTSTSQVIFKFALSSKDKFIVPPVKIVAEKEFCLKTYAAVSQTEPLNMKTVLNTVRVSSVKMSSDALYSLVSLVKCDEKSGKDLRWSEVVNNKTGKTLFSTKNTGNYSSVRWLKGTHSFSYVKSVKSLSSVWKYDLDRGIGTEVLSGVKNFFEYSWSDNNKFIIYSVYKKDKTKDGYSHIKKMSDRRLMHGYHYEIFMYSVRGKLKRRLTSFKDDFSSFALSPDSTKLLIQKIEDTNERPFLINHFFLMNLKTGELSKLFSDKWVNSFKFYTDKKILFLGGPSAFSGTGNVLDNDVIPNDFDTQLFVWDTEKKSAEPVSKDFAPSIDSLSVCGSKIYALVTEGSFRNIYRVSLKNKRFHKIKIPVEVARSVSFDKTGSSAAVWGSSSARHHKLYMVNLRKGKYRLLKDFNREIFSVTVCGKVKDWNFKNRNNETVFGRVYYPPDFDQTKKYPVIVYYYGGTSPVSRDFGGRYPKNWYASKGYLVYVLQPSGTTGYGQKWSARHVNDWGKTTSQEIIRGVKEFLKAHPYADPKRVGAMGASYGGFMTQYLAANSSLFSAFISHAGISSLSSYWGIGDWGFDYSAVATAKSYPWNRKDIYVEQSPLFMADRINTPLLLLHGDADNNVPLGESYQMFAALKVLKKEVALVTFKGQRHFILEYKKRKRWMNTIIAWFDRYLKKEPAFWNELYGGK